MANFIYNKAREGFLNGSLSWTDDTIKATLVDAATYTPDPTHATMESVPSGARVATTTVSGKTATDGVADCDDPVWAAVTGATAEIVMFWKDGGTDATSIPIAMIDTATNLPLTPNGGNITGVIDNGANKLFKL